MLRAKAGDRVSLTRLSERADSSGGDKGAFILEIKDRSFMLAPDVGEPVIRRVFCCLIFGKKWSKAVVPLPFYGKPQQARTLWRVDALVAMFDLALESSMLLREMFTLVVEQVDLAKQTIFLGSDKER